MGFSSLSPEGQLDSGLHGLNCPAGSFVEICKQLGIKVSVGGFSEAMSGKRPFDREILNRLLEVLSRMNLLQSSIDVPIARARTKEVADALTSRLILQVATEQHVSDNRIDQATSAAMSRLGAS